MDHPSLDPDALKYALQGSNATIMTEADLTDEVLNQLNAYTRKAGLTAADFYVNGEFIEHLTMNPQKEAEE